MRRMWIRSATLSVILSALALGGCRDAAAPTAAAPAAPLEARGGQRALQKMDGALPAFHAEAVIGREGGALTAGGHTLSVPRGAVSGPTRFTFSSVHEGYAEVRLTATSLGSEVHNDVGARGFTVPVVAAVSVGASGGMPRWSRLVLAWVRPDGSLEAVPSYLDPSSKRIVGRLGHFSQYAVASD